MAEPSALSKEEALQKYFGHSAFRPGQEALINALLAGRDVLGIMPTGAGKSVCYQIPALVKEGITLVVSPLISLMKDQVGALIQAGVPAAYINSSLTPGQVELALRRAARGAYRLIYVAPERLTTASFLRFARAAPIRLIAVDEAHCVSQWGQDFRPSYLDIAAFVAALPERPPVGAFTATATRLVREDTVRLLGLRDPLVRVTGFDRPNLYFAVRQPKDRDRQLLRLIAERPGQSGIIYCATRRNVDKVCDLLRLKGYEAQRYHAGMPEEERRLAQEDFQFDRAQLMVATNAFGMGIDKSSVGFVIHYNMPRNLESYYQEAGRAGRDGSEASCILLYAKQDVMLAQWMIRNGEPNPLLSPQQQEKLRRIELERLKQMTYYAAGRRCLRQTILRYFGEEAGERCGYCSVCRGERRDEALRPAAPLRRLAPAAAVPGEELRFAALRALRNLIARDQGVPAYTVFTDATLREIAVKEPRSEEAFLDISGVGEHKLARYGGLFMGFMEALGAEGGAIPQDSAGIQKLALRHYRASAPWGQDELARLRAEAAQGMALSAIARAHDRPEGAVRKSSGRLASRRASTAARFFGSLALREKYFRQCVKKY